MTNDSHDQSALHYVLPARQLTGTTTEVLAQLDELIQGLVGLRQLISQQAASSTPPVEPKRRLRLVRSLGIIVLVFGVPVCAAAQSTTGASDAAPSPAQSNGG